MLMYRSNGKVLHRSVEVSQFCSLYHPVSELYEAAGGDLSLARFVGVTCLLKKRAGRLFLSPF